MVAPEGSWLEASEAKEETLRLLQAYADLASPELDATFRDAHPRLQERVRSGKVSGAVLLGPKDDGVALSIWNVAPRLGRQVFVAYLSEGYRNATVLSSLLDHIDGPDARLKGPVVLFSEEVPGTETEVVHRVLSHRGFQRCARPAMRRSIGGRAEGPSTSPLGHVRAYREGDRLPLQRVNALAYHKGLTRLWFEDGDMERSQARTMDLLEEGKWGRWVQEASILFEREGEILGASLVCQAPPRCPLLLSLAVHPSHQGHGIGRAILQATLDALSSLGEGELELNVVRENASAFHLYSSMGFAVVPGTSRAFWLREPSAAVRT